MKPNKEPLIQHYARLKAAVKAGEVTKEKAIEEIMGLADVTRDGAEEALRFGDQPPVGFLDH
jgi:hypothetical protein